MRRIIDDKRSTRRVPVSRRSPGTAKKLTLQRETLRELTALDLQHVEGGQEDGGGGGQTSLDI